MMLSETDVLLHVLLAGHHRAPANLEAHLSGTIVDEAAKGRVRAGSSLAALLRIGSIVLLWLRLRLWWWRRS